MSREIKDMTLEELMDTLMKEITFIPDEKKEAAIIGTFMKMVMG